MKTQRLRKGVFGSWLVATWFLIASQALWAQYDAERTRYRAQDALSPQSQDAVLFVGSSSIRLWEELSQDFSDYRVIQRGFGGSTIGDLQKFAGSNSDAAAGDAWAKNVVQFYNPRAIVVWSGTNDVRPGQSGAYVAAGFQNFVSLVHAHRPDTHIFYLGITKNPHYLDYADADQRRRDANALIQSFISSSGNSKLHYIDLPSLFESLTFSSSPSMWDYYVDSLHTNKAGYALWTSKIRADLASAGILPDKVYQPNPNSPLPGVELLFDFGTNDGTNGSHTSNPDSNGSHWNNWQSIPGNIQIQAGEHVGGLVDTAGSNTGISLITTGPLNTGWAISEIPLTSNATALGNLAAPTATRDGFKWAGNYPAGFYLAGLNPARAYELRFFSSENSTSTQTTRFTATGAKTVSADIMASGVGIGDGGVNYNTRNTAILTEVVPDAFGEIHVDLAVVQGSEAHLNAMQLVVLSKQPTTITAAPAASALVFGERLSNSTLTGGTASFNGTAIPGTFAFALPQNFPPVGNSTHSVVFTPTDAGNYTTATIDIPVSVAPNPNATTQILIDFGSDLSANANYLTASPDSNGNFWNNYKTNNGTLSNLLFTDNSTSGIALAGVNTVAGAPGAGGWGISNGTVNLTNSKLNVFNAYTDGIYVFSGNATLTFSGLDSSKRYSFELFGARAAGNATATGNRTTLYTMTSASGVSTRTLQTSGYNLGAAGGNYNTSNTVVFGNQVPDGTNRITLRFEGQSGQTTGSYLNALQMTVESGNSQIFTPPVASTITFGQVLANATLTGGNASGPGAFAFASPFIAPPVGTSTQQVVFTPADSGNFTTATVGIPVSVAKAVPTVQSLPTPSVILHGEPVGSSILSGGTASVPGSFTFASPADLPVLGSSQHVVVFTPSDSGNYTTTSVLVNVLAAASLETPSIVSLPVASPIVFGQTLASSALSAGSASVNGSFAFASPQTQPAAGHSSHAVVFTPLDVGNYTTATTNVTVTVSKALPTVITPPAPSVLLIGQALGNATLSNGTASIPGTFSFANPQTQPPGGNSTQSVVFTPTDSGNYTSTTFDLPVVVNPGARGIFLVDFGPSSNQTLTNGADQWNNMSNSTAVALREANGAASYAVLSYDSSGPAFQVNGPPTIAALNTPLESDLGKLAAATATQDFYYHSLTTANFTVSGLSPVMSYTLRLFGSRDSTQTRVTTFSATGANAPVTASVTTSGVNSGGTGINTNTAQMAVLSGVRPDASGRIILGVTRTSGDFAHFNAMEVFSEEPEIHLAEPQGVPLSSGASLSLAVLPLGDPADVRTFVISNSGPGTLQSISLSKVGSAAADFTVAGLTSNSVAAGSNATFTVQFSPSAAGNRSAQILVASNDRDENPFVLDLSARGLSAAQDTDGDGVNDVAEYRLATLGFNWQSDSTALAATLRNHANTVGLYSAEQMQALSVGLPVLSRNSTTGGFTLKLRLKKSTNLQSFELLPFTVDGTFVNPATGEIEFDFTPPENAAFFRIEAE